MWPESEPAFEERGALSPSGRRHTECQAYEKKEGESGKKTQKQGSLSLVCFDGSWCPCRFIQNKRVTVEQQQLAGGSDVKAELRQGLSATDLNDCTIRTAWFHNLHKVICRDQIK